MRPAPLASASPTATSLLTIDLGAMRANYRALKDAAGDAECAGVVKANAYGTGAEQAVQALMKEECRTFFVATFNEAEAIRNFNPDITLYVLDGFFPGSGDDFSRMNIRPVLSSLDEVKEWAEHCEKKATPLPAAIHVDTGMNRLGMPRREAENLASSRDLLGAFHLSLLISHLACADEPDHPLNEKQLKTFEELRALFPDVPASLANSAGTLTDPRYRFDMVRAGFALYGGEAVAGKPPLSPVVQLHARIAQIHEAKAGESVGYGAAQTLKRDTRIATLSLGYADGIMRCLGASDDSSGLTGYIGEHPAPVLGRVSMDLITLDVTDIPEDEARRGDWVEILGEHRGVDDLGKQAGTIGYEVLTSLSRRAQRVYLD